MLNVVITGANRGIGLALTRLYAVDHHVTALCRTASEDLASLENVAIIESVNLSDHDSLATGIAQCPKNIDILINNAGILQRVGLDPLDDTGITRINDQFQVNALAPLIVVHHALPKLNNGSKVVLITSRMGSIADNDSGGHYGYRMSKAALNMAGKSLSIDLKNHGISVGIIHPGWVQTDMTGHTGHYTVHQSASQIIERVSELSLNNSGSFWHSDGKPLPW